LPADMLGSLSVARSLVSVAASCLSYIASDSCEVSGSSLLCGSSRRSELLNSRIFDPQWPLTIRELPELVEEYRSKGIRLVALRIWCLRSFLVGAVPAKYRDPMKCRERENRLSFWVFQCCRSFLIGCRKHQSYCSSPVRIIGPCLVFVVFFLARSTDRGVFVVRRAVAKNKNQMVRLT
jgi:hypothetical protein